MNWLTKRRSSDSKHYTGTTATLVSCDESESLTLDSLRKVVEQYKDVFGVSSTLMTTRPRTADMWVTIDSAAAPSYHRRNGIVYQAIQGPPVVEEVDCGDDY